MKIKILAILAVLLFCSGCSSLLFLEQRNQKTGPYPGARVDAHLIARPSLEDFNLSGHNGPPDKELHFDAFSPLVVLYGLIDLPLSAVLDTLLLPWDLWYPADKY